MNSSQDTGVYYLLTDDGNDHLIPVETDIIEFLEEEHDLLSLQPVALPSINEGNLMEELLSITNNPNAGIALDPLITQELLRQHSITQELLRQHSWKLLIMTTKPLKVDSKTLSNYPIIREKITRAIIFYNNTLLSLIQCYIEDNVDNVEWNKVLNKNKALLFSQIQKLCDQIPTIKVDPDLLEHLKESLCGGVDYSEEYVNLFGVPKNVLNNLVNNLKRKYKKK